MKLHPTLLFVITGISALALGACASGPSPASESGPGSASPATAASPTTVATMATPAAAPAPAAVAAVVAKVEFATQVKPLFQAYCYQCHGNGRNRGGVRLDLKTEAMKHITPGNSAKSDVYRAITRSMDASDHMPPVTQDQPGDDDITTIKQWIEQGANWPDGV